MRAVKQPNFDIEMFPPFIGFPKEGVAFLRNLKKNNNREWFNAHKPEYEEYVKLPMQSLIQALRGPMKTIAPEVMVDPKKNMFRIYRDTRFSKNKLPYKTHVAAVFPVPGRWEESACLYVHIEPGEVYLGGGIYMPDSQQLKLIRAAIASRPEEFLSILNDRTFKKKFNGLEGEKLRRNPQGYPVDHPMIEWLKYKQFFVGCTWEEKECYSPRFAEKVAGRFADLVPLVRFLNGAIGK
jgi:uncharacterized protein (TIGR02453 family)